MTTSNPRDPDNGSTDIRSNAIDDATWFDEFTIELRLLGVRGDAIGDALASAREFLADSGTSALECFGSPKRYSASRSSANRPRPRLSPSNREFDPGAAAEP